MVHDGRDAFGVAGLAEFAQRPFLARLVRTLQRLDTLDVGVAVERGAERRAEVADEGLHARAQRRAAPGRQGQQAGLERLVEVVEITEIGRHVLARRALAQQAEGGRVLAAAGIPEHEHVVAGVAHREAEADRLDGALLTKVAGVVGERFGGVEAEAGGVAALAQCRRRQWHEIGHGFDLSSGAGAAGSAMIHPAPQAP